MAVEQTSITQQAVANLIRLRHERGISARDLSERLAMVNVDLSRAQIANLENQRRADFTLTQVIGIARVFDVSIEWLITAHGPKCNQCLDEPPAGYRCLICNAEGEVEVS
jgi:transcriptional regulator with XRE-family HTH domain